MISVHRLNVLLVTVNNDKISTGICERVGRVWISVPYF